MILLRTGKYKTPLLQNIRKVAATTILIIKNISNTDMLYLSVASQGPTVFATSWTNCKIQTACIHDWQHLEADENLFCSNKQDLQSSTTVLNID